MGAESCEAVTYYQHGQALIEQAAEAQREHVHAAEAFLEEIVAAIVT